MAGFPDSTWTIIPGSMALEGNLPAPQPQPIEVSPIPANFTIADRAVVNLARALATASFGFEGGAIATEIMIRLLSSPLRVITPLGLAEIGNSVGQTAGQTIARWLLQQDVVQVSLRNAGVVDPPDPVPLPATHCSKCSEIQPMAGTELKAITAEQAAAQGLPIEEF